AWMNNTSNPDELEAHQHTARSVAWRTEPDGMTTFTLRLQTLTAGILIAVLTSIVLRAKPGRCERTGRWPSLAQQHADALHQLLITDLDLTTELIIHVRGDGCTLDDGTPIADTIVERIAPTSFVRALIHDAQARPVNASTRRRHPTARQKRVVKERDQTCVDCGSDLLLEYDHTPDYTMSKRTTTNELTLRCAPCHHQRHQQHRSH
ncbi:MAG: hypothetical protein ACR2QO_02835, partial [Acidimicrobiales bacterium]